MWSGLAQATAALDYAQNEKLSRSLADLEKYYSAESWDEAIELGRKLMKDAPEGHPAKQRAYDIVLLSVEKQNKDKVEKQEIKMTEEGKKTSQQLVTEGSALMGQNKYSEALERFRRAARSYGGDSETHYLIGYALQKMGDNQGAYDAYKDCVNLNPDHPRALFHLSELSFLKKNAAEAEDFSRRLIVTMDKRMEELQSLIMEQKTANFNDMVLATARKIAALKRNLAQATYLLGILTEARGAFPEAKTNLGRSVKLDPSSMDAYYHYGKVLLKASILHQSSVALEQAIFIGENSLREERIRSKKLLDANKPDEAVSSEQKVKSLTKKLSLCHYARAIVAWKIRDFGTAMDEIEKTLTMDPDMLPARFAKSVFLADKGDYPVALFEMREILKKTPSNSPDAVRAIKTIKFLMNRSASKVAGMETTLSKKSLVKTQEVDKYVKHMPGLGGRKAEAEWQDLFPAMREIQDLMNKGNIPEAVVQLKHWKIQHPDVSEINTMLGHCYVEEGRWTDAIGAFKDAVALNPNEPEALANLAYIYALKGVSLDEALNLVKKAMKLEADRAEFYHTLGWIYFKMGELEKASVELKKALELKPKYTLARYNLGLTYYLMGIFENASDCFDQVIVNNPSHVKAILFKSLAMAKLNKVPEAVSQLEELIKKLPPKEVLLRVVTDLHDKLKLAYDRHYELPVPEIKNPAPIQKLLKEARRYRNNGLVSHAKDLYLECQRLSPKEFAPWYELGAMYAESGLSAPALRTWEQAKKINPNVYDLQFNIGKMQYRLQQRDLARQAFVNAQGLQPSDPEPHYYLGLMAYEEERFESAESCALAAIRLKPRFYKALALLGMARIRLGRLEPARDAYETIYAHAPADSSIRRHARKKLWEIGRLMAPARAPSIEDVREVERQMRAKREGEIDGTKQIKRIKPLNVSAPEFKTPMSYDDKMWILKRMENFSSIDMQTPVAPMKTGASGQEELSSSDKAWVMKRVEMFAKQRNKYAIPPKMSSKYKLHETKQVRPPDKADEFIKKGIEAAEKGFMAEALSALEKAKEVSPKNIDVLLNLGFLHTLLGNFKNAFDVFALAAFHYPKNPLPHLALGNLYWFGGKGKEAVAEWRNIVGKIELDLQFNLLARSEQVWKRVLEVNPTELDAHSNLGVVYLFSGKNAEALTEFKSVLSLAPARLEHGFYQAQVNVMLYLKTKGSAYKKEAKTVLSNLEFQSPPFPHAASLRAFVETL